MLGTMAKRHSPKGRSRERGATRVITMELDPRLAKVLDEYADTTRPRTSRRAIIEYALEEFFAKHGVWPPHEDVDDKFSS